MCCFAAEELRLLHVRLMWPVNGSTITTEWYITEGGGMSFLKYGIFENEEAKDLMRLLLS